jgi:AcrR family transcriptional regulator
MTLRNTAEFANLRRAAWEHRVRGLSFADISAALNVPTGTLYRWMREMSDEAAAQAREMAAAQLQIEIDRIDRWQSNLELQLEQQVAAGKSAARTVEVLSKLSERRAKLLGMDAPEKVDATIHEVTQEDLAVAELVREAQAAAAVEVQRVQEGER